MVGSTKFMPVNLLIGILVAFSHSLLVALFAAGIEYDIGFLLWIILAVSICVPILLSLATARHYGHAGILGCVLSASVWLFTGLIAWFVGALIISPLADSMWSVIYDAPLQYKDTLFNLWQGPAIAIIGVFIVHMVGSKMQDKIELDVERLLQTTLLYASPILLLVACYALI